MVLKGNILYSLDQRTIHAVKNGYLIVHGNAVEKVCTDEEFAASDCSADKFIDYGNKLIIPGMTDLHLHASQYPFCGVVPDKELLDWLKQYAFPEEMKYADMDYAQAAYERFVSDLLKSPTTRACVYTTIHKDSALKLSQMMKEKGFAAYIGKVNMDRGEPPKLLEDTNQSLKDTEEFIEEVLSWNCAVKPIITPRFVPSCTDALMEGLGILRNQYDVPVQSHLSENLHEIEEVKRLNKKARFYGDAYDMFGLFGGGYPAVMAHCVHSGDEEIALMKQNDVFVAHCANSNFSLASGIAPVRKYLDEGLNIGLGTDIAGGFSLSMFRAIQDTIAVSKLYYSLKDHVPGAVTFAEAFYLATMGGGSFFGRVGSFQPGYEADILVLDDACEPDSSEPDLEKRLERLCFLEEKDAVYVKYINGQSVYRKGAV